MWISSAADYYRLVVGLLRTDTYGTCFIRKYNPVTTIRKTRNEGKKTTAKTAKIVDNITVYKTRKHGQGIKGNLTPDTAPDNNRYDSLFFGWISNKDFLQ